MTNVVTYSHPVVAPTQYERVTTTTSTPVITLDPVVDSLEDGMSATVEIRAVAQVSGTVVLTLSRRLVLHRNDADANWATEVIAMPGSYTDAHDPAYNDTSVTLVATPNAVGTAYSVAVSLTGSSAGDMTWVVRSAAQLDSHAAAMPSGIILGTPERHTHVDTTDANQVAAVVIAKDVPDGGSTFADVAIYARQEATGEVAEFVRRVNMRRVGSTVNVSYEGGSYTNYLETTLSTATVDLRAEKIGTKYPVRLYLIGESEVISWTVRSRAIVEDFS